MTRIVARAQRIVRVMDQLNKLERLRLEDSNQKIIALVNDERRLIGHMSDGQLGDARLLKALSRRLQTASIELHKQRQFSERQEGAVRSANVKKRLAEKQLAICVDDDAQNISRTELAAAIDDTLVRSLIQRAIR